MMRPRLGLVLVPLLLAACGQAGAPVASPVFEQAAPVEAAARSAQTVIEDEHHGGNMVTATDDVIRIKSDGQWQETSQPLYQGTRRPHVVASGRLSMAALNHLISLAYALPPGGGQRFVDLAQYPGHVPIFDVGGETITLRVGAKAHDVHCWANQEPTAFVAFSKAIAAATLHKP